MYVMYVFAVAVLKNLQAYQEISFLNFCYLRSCPKQN